MNFRHLSSALLLGFVALIALGCEQAPTELDPEGQHDQKTLAASSEGGRRIVALGGDVTEIIYALGAGDDVVAADRGSLYPPAVLELPRLDYHRHIAVEGVLSLEPTLVVATEESGPPTALDQLRSAGVEVAIIPRATSVEGAYEKIALTGAALGLEDAAATLADDIRTKLATVASGDTTASAPRVLFLYARQGIGAPLIGGIGSGADEMIALAGATSAASDLRGFVALTPEALLELNPDVILMLEHGVDAAGGEDAIFELPGMSETAAGRRHALVVMPDDLLLSYGPRLPEAVTMLRDAIADQLAITTEQQEATRG